MDNKLKSRIYIFLAFFLLTGCTEKGNSVDASRFCDYSIEQSRSCFCPYAGNPVKLYVAADTIADAVWLSNNEHLNSIERQAYRTIEELFMEIEYWDTSSTFQVSAIFDSVDHYPSYVSISPKPIIANDTIIGVICDADVSYRTWNYKKYK
jgi:hypothetical protein